VFDAPVPQYESPKSSRPSRRPGRRYGSSATNAVLAVAGGVVVSGLVFLGASALIKTPTPTTVPTVTPTTTQPASSPAPNGASVQQRSSSPSGSTVTTNPALVVTPATTPTTVPFRGGDDNAGQTPTSGEGNDEGNGEGDH